METRTITAIFVMVFVSLFLTIVGYLYSAHKRRAKKGLKTPVKYIWKIEGQEEVFTSMYQAIKYAELKGLDPKTIYQEAQ